MDDLDAWVIRAVDERVALAAVARALRGRGEGPARAWDLAEEAVANALMNALESRPEIADFGHFCKWLRRAALHRATDAHRRERCRAQWAVVHAQVLAASGAGPTADGRLAEVQAVSRVTDDEMNLLRRWLVDEMTLSSLGEELWGGDGRTSNARCIAMHRLLGDVLDRLRRGAAGCADRAAAPGAEAIM